MSFRLLIDGIYKGTIGIFEYNIGFAIAGIIITLIFGSCIIYCAIGVPFIAAQDIIENNLIEQFFDGTIKQSDYYGVLCVVQLVRVTAIAMIIYVILSFFDKYDFIQFGIAIQVIAYVIVMQYTNYQDFLLTSQGFYEWLAFVVGIFSLLLLGIVGGLIISIITVGLGIIVSMPMLMLKCIFISNKLKSTDYWKKIDKLLGKQDYEQIEKIRIEQNRITLFYNQQGNKEIEEIELNEDLKETQDRILHNLIKRKIPKYFYRLKRESVFINKKLKEQME